MNTSSEFRQLGCQQNHIHPLFGELEYDYDYEEYKTDIIVAISGKETKVELIISEIEEVHCATYKALMGNWGKIIQNVLQSILEYQNEEWGATNHTQSFPFFKTVDDVLEHTELFGIRLHAHPEQEGQYVILSFSAECVNNDYRVLSVALINEKVAEVTDQAICD